MKHMLKWILVFSCFYWGLLLFSSQMDVVHDAKGYEDLGRMIVDHGVETYFKTGPHREPLYPLTIAASMYLAQVFHGSYQFIQGAFQLVFLLISQILLMIFLMQIKVVGLKKQLTLKQ